MYPQIACEPPPGLVTVIEGRTVMFWVAVSNSEANDLQLSIWHDGSVSRLWEELILQPVHDDDLEYAIMTSRQTEPSDVIQYFRATFECSVESLHFTLKFRVGSGEWQWLNDRDPKPDGTIICQTRHLPEQLDDVLENWDASWQTQSQQPSYAGSLGSLWLLTTDVEASSALHSSWSSCSLGQPKKAVEWFALVRHSAPWLGPRHGNALFNPDKDAILASFLREDGLHVVLLALNGVPHLTTTLGSDGDGKLIVTTRNDGEERGSSAVIVSVSTSLEAAIGTATASAKVLLCGAHQETRDSDATLDPELERWYDAFTYCTWNGLGQKLSERKLLAALEQLKANGLDISNLIIDDNWQSLDFQGDTNFDYKWSEFEANKEGFPLGLKHTISKIRTLYPGIKHIAVWHGIFGYWGGIDPNGDIVKRYRSRTSNTQTGESYLPNSPLTTVQGEEVAQMYDDFYSFLVDSGVDSVKADNQFMPDYLAEAPDRRDTLYTYQNAWLAAVQKHFQHRGISCMSQTPQILFHTFLAPSGRPPYLTRNSDDFFPDEPTSHAWHIFCNAHNSLFTQFLNLFPDWDMFQTAGQFATIHAVARCLSGGPLYITDPPGQHDLELIERMTAKAVDGRSIALRPEFPAVAMEPYVSSHSDRLLRLGTAHRGISLLGLFNFGGLPVKELVSLKSFSRVSPQKSYIVHSHFGRKLSRPMHCDDEMPVALVDLPSQGVEILGASPVEDRNGVKFAILGLLGKMTGPAAIRDLAIESEPNESGIKVIITLKALGILGIWLADTQYLTEERITATVHVDDNETAVAIHREEQGLLQLDIEEACRPFCEKSSISTNAKLTVRFGKD